MIMNGCKEYEVKFVTKKGGYRTHTWYVRAANLKAARKEFDREYAEDGHTAHPFDIQIRLHWDPAAKESMCIKLRDMIAKAIKNNDYAAIRKTLRTGADWNDKHPDEEIFLYEGDGEVAVEDDMFRYNAE